VNQEKYKMVDSTATYALIVMVVVVSLAVTASLFQSSARSKQAWSPIQVDEKRKISPFTLIESAYSWFVSAKQQDCFVEALTRTSYALANLRAVQSTDDLHAIKGATLPSSVGGPSGLLEKVSMQHSLYAQEIRQSLERASRQQKEERTVIDPTQRLSKSDRLERESEQMYPLVASAADIDAFKHPNRPSVINHPQALKPKQIK